MDSGPGPSCHPGMTTTKNAPVARGVSLLNATDHVCRSGGGLLGRAVDHLRLRGGRADRNVAGLLGLRDLADEIDVEQAMLKRGVLHDHEVGKLEYALEGARRDATV